MSDQWSGGFRRPSMAARWLVRPASPASRENVAGPAAGNTIGGIQVKPGADVGSLSPSITSVLPKVADTWRDNGGPAPVITSGRDSQAHKRGSKHYENEAIDIRCNNIPDEHCQRITDGLQKSLGPDYDVIFERFPQNPARDHVHIEHDPKPRSSDPKAPISDIGRDGDKLSVSEWMKQRNRDLGLA